MHVVVAAVARTAAVVTLVAPDQGAVEHYTSSIVNQLIIFRDPELIVHVQNNCLRVFYTTLQPVNLSPLVCCSSLMVPSQAGLQGRPGFSRFTDF